MHYFGFGGKHSSAFTGCQNYDFHEYSFYVEESVGQKITKKKGSKCYLFRNLCILLSGCRIATSLFVAALAIEPLLRLTVLRQRCIQTLHPDLQWPSLRPLQL